MTSIQRIKADAAHYLAIELMHVRRRAKTVEEFNATTVLIYNALARAKFNEPDGFTEPWAEIMGRVLEAIAQNAFHFPYKFDQEDGEDILCIRTSHVMDHLTKTTWLREKWDHMPIRTDRALKKQLKQAGVLITDAKGNARPFERTIRGRRVAHMVGLRLSALHRHGLGTFAATQGAFPFVTP